MGIPAPINRLTGTVQDSSILPGWVGIDAAAEASARLSLPVVVENDANLGALAELTWGAAKGRSEVAYLKVASGVGGGLISGGRLSHGVGGTAGEIGHTVVTRERPRLPLRQPRLPRNPCVDPRRDKPPVSEPARAGLDPAHARARCGGDAATLRLIGDAGRALGVAVANLCNIVNPECVVIGGDMALAGDALFNPVREVVSQKRDPLRRGGHRDRRRRARRASRDARRPRARNARVRAIRRPRPDGGRMNLQCKKTNPNPKGVL